MKMNIKPAFRYQFSSFLKGSVVIYLILMVVVAAVLIYAYQHGLHEHNKLYRLQHYSNHLPVCNGHR